MSRRGRWPGRDRPTGRQPEPRANGHPSGSSDRRQREARRLLAVETARLIVESGITDHGLARRKAADRLGLDHRPNQLSDAEIEAALDEHRRLFQHDHDHRQRHKRQVAATVMQHLASFRPRLVGEVLDGQAEPHTPIRLHVFSDDADALVHFLLDHGIPFDPRSRRVRADRERPIECPCLSFSVSGEEVQCLVLPDALLRQPPLEPGTDRPIRRADRAQVLDLLRSP